MSTHRIFPLLSAVLGAAAVASAGCTPKQDPGVRLVVPPPESAAPAVLATAAPGSKPQPAVAADVVSVAWPHLESLPFARRSEFLAGVERMESAVGRQVAELTAIRTAMKSTVATADWDFAMKEMNDARTYLTSMGEEAAKANADTWEQKKAKVGQAWVRAQEAYDKVKSTTTS